MKICYFQRYFCLIQQRKVLYVQNDQRN